LAGRVPANVVALVKQAEIGAELSCRAHEKEFTEHGIVVCRGVISYYASATLARANDLSSWLARIEQMGQEDLATSVITKFYQPVLQIAGDVNFPLPGSAEPSQPL
jgi:hypothetical protein